MSVIQSVGGRGCITLESRVLRDTVIYSNILLGLFSPSDENIKTFLNLFYSYLPVDTAQHLRRLFVLVSYRSNLSCYSSHNSLERFLPLCATAVPLTGCELTECTQQTTQTNALYCTLTITYFDLRLMFYHTLRLTICVFILFFYKIS